jgi:hypothetical protein
MRASIDEWPDAVSVAHGPNGRHWVFVGIPRGLLTKVARDSDSVNSLQGLFLLNEIHDVTVSRDSLVDVNTPDLLPGASSSVSERHGDSV